MRVAVAAIFLAACSAPRPQAFDDAGGAADAAIGDPDAGAPDAGAPDAGGPPLRVLFIGNSYTYVNDLPGMLARFGVVTDSVVQGGATLETHWNNGIAQGRIADGGWTHVVLQGQSQEPYFDFVWFDGFAQRFSALVADAGATTTWYVTWARAAGDESYSMFGFSGPEEQQDWLTAAYDAEHREAPGSVLACVGEAFRRSLEQRPDLVLHQSDLSHPTVAGTYLAACTFYVALTGQEVPQGAFVPDGINAADAEHLRHMALVGSDCADVHVKAVVRPTDRIEFADGGPPFDYLTQGLPTQMRFGLRNTGGSTAGLSDGMTLAPPFSWTSGTFPGGTGGDFCGASLDAGSSCEVSVTFSGASSGTGRFTVALTNAYQQTASRSLRGTSTDRALLLIGSEYDTAFACAEASPSCGSLSIDISGGPTANEFRVINRGALPAQSLALAAPLGPYFGWGLPLTPAPFPGASGMPYCEGAPLAPGESCTLRVYCAPDAGQLPTTTIDLSFADSQGLADVTRTVMCFNWFSPPLPPK